MNKFLKIILIALLSIISASIIGAGTFYVSAVLLIVVGTIIFKCPIASIDPGSNQVTKLAYCDSSILTMFSSYFMILFSIGVTIFLTVQIYKILNKKIK